MFIKMLKKLYQYIMKTDIHEQKVEIEKREMKLEINRANIDIAKANYMLKKTIAGDIFKASGGFTK